MRCVKQVVLDAIKGGATMVQLRNKSDSVEVIEEQAREIKEVLDGSGVPFIINDHVEIAVKIDADGAHIGQGDLTPQTARQKLGVDKILGLTAYTREHYAAINPAVVNYVGTGPVYKTKTKPDKPVLGLKGFEELVKYAPIPVVGIGGVTAENAHNVIKAGASGVAMMRGISEADNVESAACDFLRGVRK